MCKMCCRFPYTFGHFNCDGRLKCKPIEKNTTVNRIAMLHPPTRGLLGFITNNYHFTTCEIFLSLSVFFFYFKT